MEGPPLDPPALQVMLLGARLWEGTADRDYCQFLWQFYKKPSENAHLVSLSARYRAYLSLTVSALFSFDFSGGVECVRVSVFPLFYPSWWHLLP